MVDLSHETRAQKWKYSIDSTSLASRNSFDITTLATQD